MRIASWNVNSVRARLPLIEGWLESAQPDVVLLQEIKCETKDFPALAFKEKGYESSVLGQKSYNGVAILSRLPCFDVKTTLPGQEDDSAARYIEAQIGPLTVACLYAPNGNPAPGEKFDNKLLWMKNLKRRAAALLEKEIPVVFGGDFNVIPRSIDVYAPESWTQDALFRPETRAAWREIVALGYTDAFRVLHPHDKAYTFWDYQAGAWPQNRGLRIDHFLLSPEAMDRTTACTIDRAPRGQEKASDHTPIVVDFV